MTGANNLRPLNTNDEINSIMQKTNNSIISSGK